MVPPALIYLGMQGGIQKENPIKRTDFLGLWDEFHYKQGDRAETGSKVTNLPNLKKLL